MILKKDLIHPSKLERRKKLPISRTNEVSSPQTDSTEVKTKIRENYKWVRSIIKQCEWKNPFPQEETDKSKRSNELTL